MNAKLQKVIVDLLKHNSSSDLVRVMVDSTFKGKTHKGSRALKSNIKENVTLSAGKIDAYRIISNNKLFRKLSKLKVFVDDVNADEHGYDVTLRHKKETFWGLGGTATEAFYSATSHLPKKIKKRIVNG